MGHQQGSKTSSGSGASGSPISSPLTADTLQTRLSSKSNFVLDRSLFFIRLEFCPPPAAPSAAVREGTMAQVPRGPPPGFAARPPPPGFEHRIPARTVSSEAYTAATTVPPPAPVVTSTSRSRSEPQSGLANAHLAAARGNEPPVPQARPPRDHHKRQSSGCEPRSSPAAARRQRSADGNAAASVASASRLDSVMSTSTVEAPTCLVCCDDLAYLAVGKCNHGICHVCSLRSRVLCNSNSCPVCRADLKQILISQDINAVYEKVSKKQLLFDRRHRAYFSSTEAQQGLCTEGEEREQKKKKEKEKKEKMRMKNEEERKRKKRSEVGS